MGVENTYAGNVVAGEIELALSIYFANKQCLQSIVRLLVGGLGRVRGPGVEEGAAEGRGELEPVLVGGDGPVLGAGGLVGVATSDEAAAELGVGEDEVEHTHVSEIFDGGKVELVGDDGGLVLRDAVRDHGGEEGCARHRCVFGVGWAS